MIAVYHIDEKITKRTDIGNKELINIDKILSSILGSSLQGFDGERYFYKITKSEHFLRDFSTLYFPQKSVSEDTFDKIASRLYEAELVTSRERRNINITKGLLFIRFYENRIVFLKLEEVESIDKDTFEIGESYALDKKYYKALIYTGDTNRIIVIDRGGRVANYWANDFLQLEKANDSSTNTATLVKALKNNSLFNKSINNRDRQSIRKNLIKYLKESNHFEFEAFLLSTGLNLVPETYNAYIKNAFSPKILDNLDSSFTIDEKEIQVLYSIDLKTSDTTTIKSKDIADSIRRREIDIDKEERIIKIRIDEDKFATICNLIDEYRIG